MHNPSAASYSNEDEGWFTSQESKQLSQNLQPPIKASQATQKKLMQFYDDIDKSLTLSGIHGFKKGGMLSESRDFEEAALITR